MNEVIKWKNELDTYRTIKSAFILEGEVNDLQLWESEDGYDLLSLDQCLYEYLRKVGYRCITFYNRIDGFYNEFDGGEEMLKEFSRITSVGNPHKVSIKTAAEMTRTVMKNYETATAMVINLSSLLVSSPNHLDGTEIENFATFFLGSKVMGYAEADNESGMLNNLMFFVTNRANDLPAWLYVDNPYMKVLSIPKPSTELRNQIFQAHKEEIYDWDSSTEEERKQQLKKLICITEGFSCIELDGVLSLCGEQHTPLSQMQAVINAYRYGQKDDLWEKYGKPQLKELGEKLKEDVIGQDKAVSQVTDIIKRAANGLSGLQHSSAGRPRGVMFFAGPTGTGKTELAKSLARNVFGDESALIRFDMSEYGHEHSDQRLLGAPPGYVGYEAGGELTNAVKAHPFSILLFDEIEKAHPSILDKFLQILDDGRLTDSKGETVYFSETIIIFTSNKGIYKEVADPDNPYRSTKIPLVTPEDDYSKVERSVQNAVRDYFVSELGRPEILNRIGNNLIVFGFITGTAADDIVRKQINHIISYIHESKRMTVSVGEAAQVYLKEKCRENLDFGGRGIGNAIEKYFVNPLARVMADEEWKAGETYQVMAIREAEKVKLECRKGE